MNSMGVGGLGAWALQTVVILKKKAQKQKKGTLKFIYLAV
jgi:hypothetical protein